MKCLVALLIAYLYLIYWLYADFIISLPNLLNIYRFHKYCKKWNQIKMVTSFTLNKFKTAHFIEGFFFFHPIQGRVLLNEIVVWTCSKHMYGSTKEHIKQQYHWKEKTRIVDIKFFYIVNTVDMSIMSLWAWCWCLEEVGL